MSRGLTGAIINRLLFQHIFGQMHGREEQQKTHIRDFLKDTWYRKADLINTADDIDLAIYAGMSASDPVSVIIETKASAKLAEPQHNLPQDATAH